MIKQATKVFTVVILIHLLTPSTGLSESGNYTKNTVNTHLDISSLNSEELYRYYIENVEMNNAQLRQNNQFRNMHESFNNGINKLEFNLTELELFEMAQVESYRLFEEWIKDESVRQEFIAMINEKN